MKEKMRKYQNNNNIKGITLLSLVITIIILIILASVSLYLLLANNGILKKAKEAKEENQKQTATEMMNFKIANIQISSYAENNDLPSLQYLADKLCEDNDIEYVLKQSKAHASLDKIDVTDVSSIYTKLKNYPYEFEIDSELRLASIDGTKISFNDDLLNIDDDVKQIINYTNKNFPITLQTLFNDKNYVDEIIKSDDALNYIINKQNVLNEAIDSQYMMISLFKSEKKENIISQLMEKSTTNPELTSSTGSDGGHCFGTAPFPQYGYQIWHAFSNSHEYAYSGIGNFNIGYNFNDAIWCFKFSFKQRSTGSPEGIDNIVVQYSDDSTTWYNATNKITTQRNTDLQEYIIDNAIGKHCYWRIIGNGYGVNGGLSNLKFYGIN